MEYREKLQDLERRLREYGEVAVSFSGGVDSTFLLLFAKKVLGENVSAVTISAPNFAPDEIRYAQELCKNNPPDRCYICKKTLFGKVVDEMRAQLPEAVVADGTNLDDVSDYRPGRKALEELSIASPLKEAGLTKKEVRRGLKELGGDIWDKPAFACLASRIPYGETITKEKLTAIYRAESLLQDLGFRQVRVRHHGTLARIEVLPEARGDFFDLGLMDLVNERLKEFGFLYVTLDLAGYRMGSLNEEIEE